MTWGKPFVLIGAFVVLAGCLDSGQTQHEMTAEEAEQVALFEAELERIQALITEVQNRKADLAGGALLSMHEMNLAVLRSNQAILEQRIHALESGAPITQTVTGISPDEALAEALQQEMAQLDNEISELKNEVEGRGGAINLVRQMSLATKESSRALVHQRWLGAQYGVATPLAGAGGQPPVAPFGGSADPEPGISGARTAQSSNPQTQAQQDYLKKVELYDFTSRYFTSYRDERVPGVQFKLRNTGDQTLRRVEVTVFFQDAEGNDIAEQRYTPVLATTRSIQRGTSPLRPNYIWQQETNQYYAAPKVPSEWQEGAANARVTRVVFKD